MVLGADAVGACVLVYTAVVTRLMGGSWVHSQLTSVYRVRSGTGAVVCVEYPFTCSLPPQPQPRGRVESTGALGLSRALLRKRTPILYIRTRYLVYFKSIMSVLSAFLFVTLHPAPGSSLGIGTSTYFLSALCSHAGIYCFTRYQVLGILVLVLAAVVAPGM